MNKTATVLMIILVILVIGIITLGSVMFTNASSSYGSNYNSYSSEINNKDYGYPYNYTYSNLPKENPCYGSSRVGCFKYPEVPQQKLEPCPAPRPVCPLCNKGLAQEKGEGHMDIPAQVKVSC